MKSTLHKDIRAKMRVDTYSNFQQQQAYYPLSRSIVFRNLYEWLYFSQYISVLHQKASINIIGHLYGKIRHTYSKERRIIRKSDKFFRRTKFVPKTINFCSLLPYKELSDEVVVIMPLFQRLVPQIYLYDTASRTVAKDP